MREVLEDVAGRYPALEGQLFEGGTIAPFVNVYLGGEDVRTLDGLETCVRTGRPLILLPAMAGGARQPHSPPSLLDLVGNTPLVELTRLTPKATVRIYAKLEGQNPTGSIKDRVAKAMIEAAEASGELQPGRELLEPTSGNTGISLALIAKLKGYPLTCVMPRTRPRSAAAAAPLRRRDRRLARRQGSNGAVRLALELAERDPRYFMPFQYANEANPRAHYEGTGAEIAEALDRVDVLVAGLGTGGTLMGTGARLRETFPDVVVAAAEPLPGDPVMGLRSLEDGYVPPILDVDEARPEGARLERGVGRGAARAARHARASSRGVSAGAVVHVARKLAAELDEGVVVCVLADGGWKYLSADFWEADDVEQSMERTVWWWSRPRFAPSSLAHAERGGAERGLRARRPPRRRRRAVHPRAERRRVAVPLRARRRPPETWFLEDEGYELGCLPLASLLAAAPVAHRRREHRPLGRASRT